MENLDPWLQVVSSLSEKLSITTRLSQQLAQSHRQNLGNGEQFVSRKNTPINHIEWQTSCTILVSWSDSTLGRFQDQTWRTGLARKAGICFLTGVPIKKGNAVFKPQVRAGVRPSNVDDMILATMLPSRHGGQSKLYSMDRYRYPPKGSFGLQIST